MKILIYSFEAFDKLKTNSAYQIGQKIHDLFKSEASFPSSLIAKGIFSYLKKVKINYGK